MSGNPGDVAADTAAPDESGFQDPGGESDGELDTDQPLNRNGCPDCGFSGGQCMMGPDDCGIAAARAKARFAVKAAAVAASAATIDPAPPQQDQGGVWVTYFSPESEDYVTALSVHADELSALRVAVESGHRATFLKYGELLL